MGLLDYEALVHVRNTFIEVREGSIDDEAQPLDLRRAKSEPLRPGARLADAEESPEEDTMERPQMTSLITHECWPEYHPQTAEPTIPNNVEWIVPEGPYRNPGLKVTKTSIAWKVPEKSLRATDKNVLSPRVQLAYGCEVFEFKVQVQVRFFKFCRIQLKCLGSPKSSLDVTFAVRVGAAEERGPVRHDFVDKAICGLPKEIEQWEFEKLISRCPRNTKEIDQGSLNVNIELKPVPAQYQ